MFTGIIEETGTLSLIKKNEAVTTLTIQAKTVLEQTKIGDSIAANGTCLTVTALSAGYFTAELMPETMNRTTFARLTQGALLNLERALQVGSRVHGHFVTGHIDTTATLSSITDFHNTCELTFTLTEKHGGLLIDKGSIAINGISLTIIRESDRQFTVGIIPHTYQYTNLKQLKPGDTVNIEYDQQGKYIQRQLKTTNLTLETLKHWGY